ncbi:uncharacterized protein L969DRAFT_91087 [Mixia osmundae IAM 14324]|nr:uncharacterized protein L969DRAFT_91087 [Mixia osmundae IAM 14324]KEI36247.1 hypothetical protein L969DRAFT_91087 [Mixia osmundae IAM 14324]
MAPPRKNALATESGSATPALPSLAEQLSYADDPRPFKNPHYKPSAQRRNKSLKQMLAAERDRYTLKGQKKVLPASTSMVVKLGGKKGSSQPDTARNSPDEEAARLVRTEEYISYMNVEAPPSVLPAKKYCDLTGLVAPYVDPRSTLRYHNAECYEVLKTFPQSTDQSYLAVRGNSSIIK